MDKKDDFSALPESLLKSFGSLQFVMELELSAARKLAREDVVKVIASLESKGFYVQMPPVMVLSPLRVANTQLH